MWSEDPIVFNPTRWARPRPHARGASLSYGAGPRVCLGMHLANTVLVEPVTLLVRDRRLALAPTHRDNLCCRGATP
ncbi:cytochrome P450 [Janibacter melonis]|uniref:cytochrome P450 n=1 Tax=Janibacter melonis TaxID=262209 RepID=UPI003556039F